MGLVWETTINGGRPLPDTGCAEVQLGLAECQLVALAEKAGRLGISIGELIRRLIAAGLEAPGVESEATEETCWGGRAWASELRVVDGGESIVAARPRKSSENAAKYTDPGGRIGLSVTTASDGIVLKVRDSGIGIAPGLLPHIFDFFRQGPRALDYSAGGLGIGLALVRQIVELHGGSVNVMSAGPGQGSEFVVQLPQEKGREA
jgi:hypothetical protein